MITPNILSFTVRPFLRPIAKTHQKSCEFHSVSLPAASIFLDLEPWESQVSQGFFIVALDPDGLW